MAHPLSDCQLPFTMFQYFSTISDSLDPLQTHKNISKKRPKYDAYKRRTKYFWGLREDFRGTILVEDGKINCKRSEVGWKCLETVLEMWHFNPFHYPVTCAFRLYANNRASVSSRNSVYYWECIINKKIWLTWIVCVYYL